MYSEFQLAAEGAARSAGGILRRHFRSLSGLRAKGTHDLVSDADYESERTILKTLQSHFPEHSYVAEETGTIEGDSDFVWYIDPLDGTAGFAMGIPYFSTSIGLAEKGHVVMALVFNPILDELYTAARGAGAFLNGKAIRVADACAMSEALVGTAYGADDRSMRDGIVVFDALSQCALKVAVHFSPALELCNIARGRMHGYVDNGTTAEDHAAAGLILAEAGGNVEDYGESSWQVNRVGIVAACGPSLQSDLQQLVSEKVNQ